MLILQLRKLRPRNEVSFATVLQLIWVWCQLLGSCLCYSRLPVQKLSSLVTGSRVAQLEPTVDSLPVLQENCGVTVCDGKVYILGGRDEHGDSTDSGFTFDPSSGQVEAPLCLQRCTSSHGCVTIVQSLR